MSDRSAIEWTDATWNPVRASFRTTVRYPNLGAMETRIGWHCEHISEGCRYCYAESMNRRFGTGLDYKPGHRGDIEIFLDETTLLAPLRWKKPHMIFVCSMTDLFASFVTDEWIDRIFAVMALCSRHTFQVLTKRPERMREYCCAMIAGKRNIIQAAKDFRNSITDAAVARGSLIVDYPEEGEPIKIRPLPNVWLGTSCEDQAAADERIPHLLATPAAIKFVSAEPLLGSIDLTELYPDIQSENALHALAGIRANPNGTASFCRGLDWVIVGGESGPHARPMNPDWARSIREQCKAANVPFFFKQNGEFRPVSDIPIEEIPNGGYIYKFGPTGESVCRIGKKRAGRLLDGVEHNGMPLRPC
jgi:protein gp37